MSPVRGRGARAGASMIALGLALAMLGSLIAGARAFAKGPPVIGVANRRFDHDRHAASATAGGKQVACVGCHSDRPTSEHVRCTGCHTASFTSSCSVMKTPGVASPARVCRTCHTPTRLECLPKDMPPLPAAGSFSSKFTHVKHLAVGSAIERDCAVCHRVQAGAVPAQKPHALCSGCHNPNGARPAMTECTTCHASGKPAATPAAAADPYRLAAFDHQDHVSASKQNSCLTCHDKPVGDALKPQMLGCQARCHDGQKAFAATGTHCTICHKSSAPAPKLRTDLGFLHAVHQRRNVKLDDCTTCHAVDGEGVLAAPLSRKDHQPCASSGCHQAEFNLREPKICGVCHDAAVPWVRAVARPGPRVAIEWGEAMNHASHLALAPTAGQSMTCEGCHGDKRTGGAPPRDHRACATCHAHGQAPAMTACAACHTATQAMQATPPTPPAAHAGSAWSVAATFDHARHAVDPRSHRPTACTECHTQVAAARDVASVTRPRMADCDGCHDGKSAFKTTGFGCARCHAAKPIAPTAASLEPPRPRSAP